MNKASVPFPGLLQPAAWWSMGLFVVFCLLILAASPTALREPGAVALVLLTLVTVPVGLTRARPSRDSGGLDMIIALLAGFAISLLFWWRAASGSLAYEEHLGLQIISTFLFWLPGVSYVALYRHDRERMVPHGRGRFVVRLLMAAVGGLAAKAVIA